MKSSDFNIFKIRYYADGINVRKGVFEPYDRKQHNERARAYVDLFWRMAEKATGKAMSEWYHEYLSSAMECASEVLRIHDEPGATETWQRERARTSAEKVYENIKTK